MNLESLFDSFNHMKVAIIGDVMVDAYVKGKVHRMSPEAPVPVLLLNKEEARLGGARKNSRDGRARRAITHRRQWSVHAAGGGEVRQGVGEARLLLF